MQGNTEKKSTFIRCNNPVQKTVLSILSIPNFHQSKALEPTVHRHDSYSNIYLCQVPQSLKFRTYCQSPITVNNVSNFILNGSLISKWSSLPLIIHYILLLSKNLLYWLNTKERLTFLCFSDCFINLLGFPDARAKFNYRSLLRSFRQRILFKQRRSRLYTCRFEHRLLCHFVTVNIQIVHK